MSTKVDPLTLALSDDQNKAMDAFIAFMSNPLETVFVLAGYAGCGKSTLVAHIIDRMPKLIKMFKLVDGKYPSYEINLTATTNKAAESLGYLTGYDVTTIHSYLGLRLEKNYVTQETKLVPSYHEKVTGRVLVIDEASYIDPELLTHIFTLTTNCKIVFIGDPMQLVNVGITKPPVFEANFPGFELNEVMRQAKGNKIIELATMFRNTVKTGEFFQFKPDGKDVVYLSNADFEKEINAEFSRPDWKYHDSKVLAWTNKRVIEFNNHLRSVAKGDPELQVGDYAINNQYVRSNRKNVKTDATVQITGLHTNIQRYGVWGKQVMFEGLSCFMANDRASKALRLRQAQAAEEYQIAREISEEWCDLRPAYASTINKSQGSTYKRTYIDLSDIRRCNSGNQIARMMYVAVSRASDQVFLTGDLV